MREHGPRCAICTGEGPCETDSCRECSSFRWNRKIFEGEVYGYKCMRCNRCGYLQYHALWYTHSNIHWCDRCGDTTEQTNLDDMKFNPSRR